MLVDDLGQKLAAGVDLSKFEVKSALDGSSYEYQYHKLAGKKKLSTDMKVGHLFFAHRDNLRHVDLRYAHGRELKEFFLDWRKEYPRNYVQQRFRRSIPFAWVRNNARLLMTIEDGEVAYPQVAPTPAPKK